MKNAAVGVQVHVYGRIEIRGLVHVPSEWHCLDMIVGWPLAGLVLESCMVVMWNVRLYCFFRGPLLMDLGVRR